MNHVLKLAGKEKIANDFALWDYQRQCSGLRRAHENDTNSRVRLAKAALFLFLFAAWLPSTLNCEVKRAVLPMLDCCVDDSTADGKESNCNHCQFCTAFDLGGYKVSETRTTVSTSQTVIATVSAVTLTVRIQPREILISETSAPPNLSSGWHFVQRTALPPRAPSLAS